MTLVDTSVWVDHLRKGNKNLVTLLLSNRVITHPFVIGEIACGSISNRNEILELLAALPSAIQAQDTEVVQLIEQRQLYGKGVGWIDLHLIASALLTRCPLLSLDKRLSTLAINLGVSA